MSNRIKLKQPAVRAPLALGRGEAAGAVNLYQCQRGHRRFTINRDTGVTPSGMPCDASELDPLTREFSPCPARSFSQFYRLPPDFRAFMVTHEWWLPTVDEAACWPNVNRSTRDRIVDHVKQHGMMLATLTPETAERYAVGPAAVS